MSVSPRPKFDRNDPANDETFATNGNPRKDFNNPSARPPGRSGGGTVATEPVRGTRRMRRTTGRK